MHWAGMNDGCINDLKTILNQYPEYINTTNVINDNALIIAIRTDNFEIVKYLVEETSINLEHKTQDGNALSVATLYNRTNIAMYLIDKGISINELNSKYQTPLFNCARHGNDVLIEILMDKGSDIEHIDINNQNILFSLMENYISHLNYYCFELLQEKMSNPILFKTDNNGFDIINFLEYLIHQSIIDKNIFKKDKLMKSFNPILLILNARNLND